VNELFRFERCWREIPKDGIPRDYADTFTTATYHGALEAHRRACAGDWATEVMVEPWVSELRGLASGRTRIVRAAVDLWPDTRPPMSRQTFAELWRGWLGKAEKWKDAA
jgi:hypothetical protein